MIFRLTLPERFAMGLCVALGRQLRRVGDEGPGRAREAVKRKSNNATSPSCIHS